MSLKPNRMLKNIRRFDDFLLQLIFRPSPPFWRMSLKIHRRTNRYPPENWGLEDARWAPTSYKLGYNSYKSCYNPSHPFIRPFTTSRGPPCGSCPFKMAPNFRDIRSFSGVSTARLQLPSALHSRSFCTFLEKRVWDRQFAPLTFF